MLYFVPLICSWDAVNWYITHVVSFVSEQGWKAFEDTNGHLPLEGNKQGSELQLETRLSSSADQYFGLRELEVCTSKLVSVKLVSFFGSIVNLIYRTPIKRRFKELPLMVGPWILVCHHMLPWGRFILLHFL